MCKDNNIASRRISANVSRRYSIIPFIALSVRYSNTVAAFHYETWHTIINIRFHGVNQIKLHNLVPSAGCFHVVLDEQLALRVVNHHVVGSLLTSPHIDRGLNDCLLV